MSFRTLVRKLFAPKPVSPIRRPALGLHPLEAREVPAILVIDDVLTVTGNSYSDTVVVTDTTRGGLGEVTVTHSGQRVTPGVGLVNFTESARFTAGPRGLPFDSIRAELSHGDNRFTNNTSLPSVAIGGSGEDVFVGGSGIDLFLGGAGNDTLRGNGGNDSLIGEAGDDTLTGGGGDDYIVGNEGDDRFEGGAGNDTLYGNAGDDRIEGGDGDDEIRGHNGEDLIYAGSGNDRVWGGSGDDEIRGQDGNDRIWGEGGNDFLLGDSGSDDVYGGSGNDYINGGSGDDFLNGESGNDSIDGLDGVDELYGDDGDDTLRGGSGDDQLWGGIGNDTLVGGSGDDALEGEDGNDTLYGSEGDDDLRGGVGDDNLYGQDGNDDLRAGEGSDSLSGGKGDDYFHGDAGNDFIYGDEGNDTLYGQSGSDFLFGGSGNDNLNGGSGNDFLFGESGNDLLFGGTGIDILSGGAGMDRLFGGGDLDTLDGGTGSDRFLQRSGFEDVIISFASADVVVRFQNSPDGYTRSDGEKYASAFWSDDEILSADKGLGILHVTTGNTQLLKRDGEGVTIRQVGAYLSGGDGDGALGWNNDSPTFFVLDECFDDAVLGIEVVLHEIAHFWDEEGENPTADEFRAISGWRSVENPLPSGYTRSEDKEWMYLTGSAFTRTYAKTNPKEDFAETFATYWLHQLGLDSYFGGTPYEELGAKMAYMHQFRQQMS